MDGNPHLLKKWNKELLEHTAYNKYHFAKLLFSSYMCTSESRYEIYFFVCYNRKVWNSLYYLICNVPPCIEFCQFTLFSLAVAKSPFDFVIVAGNSLWTFTLCQRLFWTLYILTYSSPKTLKRYNYYNPSHFIGKENEGKGS